MTTRVIFKAEADGEILAVFPDQVGTRSPNTCVVYAHNGQHSTAQVNYCAALRPVTKVAARSLYDELVRQGYRDLFVVHEFTRADKAARIHQLIRTS